MMLTALPLDIFELIITSIYSSPERGEVVASFYENSTARYVPPCTATPVLRNLSLVSKRMCQISQPYLFRHIDLENLIDRDFLLLRSLTEKPSLGLHTQCISIAPFRAAYSASSLDQARATLALKGLATPAPLLSQAYESDEQRIRMAVTETLLLKMNHLQVLRLSCDNMQKGLEFFSSDVWPDTILDGLLSSLRVLDIRPRMPDSFSNHGTALQFSMPGNAKHFDRMSSNLNLEELRYYSHDESTPLVDTVLGSQCSKLRTLNLGGGGEAFESRGGWPWDELGAIVQKLPRLRNLHYSCRRLVFAKMNDEEDVCLDDFVVALEPIRQSLKSLIWKGRIHRGDFDFSEQMPDLSGFQYLEEVEINNDSLFPRGVSPDFTGYSWVMPRGAYNNTNLLSISLPSSIKRITIDNATRHCIPYLEHFFTHCKSNPSNIEIIHLRRYWIDMDCWNYDYQKENYAKMLDQAQQEVRQIKENYGHSGIEVYIEFLPEHFFVDRSSPPDVTRNQTADEFRS